MIDYWVAVGIVLGINVILAKSYDFIQSDGGLFSVAHAAMFGVGAYLYAILTTAAHAGLVLAMVIGVLGAAVTGGIIGKVTARLGGDYLVIGTLGLQFLLLDLAANLSITGQYNGIAAIPSVAILGGELPDNVGLLLAVACAGLLSYLAIEYVVRSPWGLALHACRDDEVSAQSLGLKPARFRVQCMALGSGFAGLAGVLFAAYLSFIDPTSFTLSGEYLLILAMVVIGGSGHWYGPLIGAVLLTLLPDGLRFVGVNSTIQGSLSSLISGMFLVVIAVQAVSFRRRRVVRTPATDPSRIDDFQEPLASAITVREYASSRDAYVSEPTEAALQPEILRVQNLRKAFGGTVAVDDLSFALPRGSTTAMIGPNGSGKTTVFNLITGFIHPDHGRITFENRDITSLAPHKIARMGIGRLFQNTRVFEGQTVLENVMTACAARERVGLGVVTGRPWLAADRKHQWRSEALQLLETLGIEGSIKKRAGDLSVGQQKAVGIARLLALGSSLILLDEPTAGLDPKRLGEVRRLVPVLQELGKTVFIIEHRMSFLADMCSKTICLDQGRLLKEGGFEEVMNHQDVRSAYFRV